MAQVRFEEFAGWAIKRGMDASKGSRDVVDTTGTADLLTQHRRDSLWTAHRLNHSLVC